MGRSLNWKRIESPGTGFSGLFSSLTVVTCCGSSFGSQPSTAQKLYLAMSYHLSAETSIGVGKRRRALGAIHIWISAKPCQTSVFLKMEWTGSVYKVAFVETLRVP